MGPARLRVLVIDDSAYNRQIISDFFATSPDFEVVGRAEDGEQGLKLVNVLKPDLVTLDIEMPRMDGFTFLRLLMSQMPTPVIVISSHSRKQEVFQALELGALDFVAKPQRFLAPESRARLVEAFYKKLRPGGFLLLGHSESLINASTRFELVPLKNDIVYRRPLEGASPARGSRG